jgi:SAM-dependent methyltransferase
MEAHYQEKYYDETSGIAAARVMPYIVNRYNPKTMIDIGCGRGEWLAEAKRLGVDGILGVDGPHVQDLKIDRKDFLEADLNEGFIYFDRKFDVALCLEVAEHLPAELAEKFVDYLASLSKVIIFSAAIPGQAGHGHINCQWQGYWAEKFRRRMYNPLVWLRNEIWNDSTIQSFYRQNIMALEFCPGLPFTILEDVVHPDFYTYKLKVSKISGFGI